MTNEEFMRKLKDLSTSSSIGEISDLDSSSQPYKINHRQSYDEKMRPYDENMVSLLHKETSGSEALLDLYSSVQKPKKHVTLERPQSATFEKDFNSHKNESALDSASSCEDKKPYTKTTLSPIRDFRPRSRSRSPMPNFEPKPEDDKLLSDLTFEPKNTVPDVPVEEKRAPTPASEIVLRSPSLDKLTDYISMKVAHRDARVADSLRAFSLGKMYHSSARLLQREDDNGATDDETDDPLNFNVKKPKRVTLSTPNMSTGPRVILCDEEKPPPVVITECSLTVCNNSQVQLWRSDIGLAHDRIFDEENLVIKEKPIAVNIDDEPPPGLLPNTDPPQKMKEIYNEIVGKNIGRVRKPRYVHNPGTSAIGTVSLTGSNTGNNDNKGNDKDSNSDLAPAIMDVSPEANQHGGLGVNSKTIVKTGLFILLSPLLFLNVYLTIIVFCMFVAQMYHFRE